MKRIVLSIAAVLILLTQGCNLIEKSQVEKMKKMAVKIESLSQEVEQKEDSYRQLLTEFGLKGDRELNPEEWKLLSLNDEQKQYLRTRLAQEEDSSYATMIQEILDKDDELNQLRNEIDELKAKFPRPVVVQPGDNHYDLCMNFLIDTKGLTPDEAQKLTERVNLLEYVLPGFEVWLFYDDNTFGTFVTQGTADQSPNQIKRFYKTKLINERDKAKDEASTLRQDVDALEQRKAALLGQLKELEKQRELMESQITDLTSRNQNLNTENTEKETRLNSVYYHVEQYDSLKEKKIVARILFGKPQLKNFNAVVFSNAIDLRNVDSINVTAQELGLEKIKKVFVMPRNFVEEKDYKINISADASTASIYIVNPEKFIMSKVLIAVK